MNQLSQEEVLTTLLQDAEKIKNLIVNQQNKLCVAHCKAFEEVVDTQMYGFSKQVDFTVRLGLLERKVGNQLLADLEHSLNQLYTEVYVQEQTSELKEV
ncbi:DUF1507 family protein [Enterococcus nangangensis]